MNKKLSEVISDFCERDMEVLVEQERDEEVSLAFDLEEDVF